MSKNKQTENESVEANKKMGEYFTDYNARATAPATSEAEEANQKIQEDFYGDGKKSHSLPFHVDVNNPPIKK